MKRTALIFLFLLLLLPSLTFARSVNVDINWYYEPAKMPPGYTVDEAYQNTSKICLYRSDTGTDPWTKIAEWPMSQFPLPAPIGGFPIRTVLDLADGATYTISFMLTEINLNGTESPKSNIVQVPFDLRLQPAPTIKVITVTIVMP